MAHGCHRVFSGIRPNGTRVSSCFFGDGLMGGLMAHGRHRAFPEMA